MSKDIKISRYKRPLSNKCSSLKPRKIIKNHESNQIKSNEIQNSPFHLKLEMKNVKKKFYDHFILSSSANAKQMLSQIWYSKWAVKVAKQMEKIVGVVTLGVILITLSDKVLLFNSKKVNNENKMRMEIIQDQIAVII